MKKLAVVVTIIAGLVYGAIWGFAWYKVKKGLDKVVNDSAPTVEISYKSIFVSPKLDGTVGVDGLVIKPKMTSDVFKIDSVRFKLPGMLYFVTAKKDEVPESMRLAVSGIQIDLNSPLLHSLSKMQKEAAAAQGKQHSSPFASLQTLGCGSVETIGLEELNRMGYQTMEIDFTTEYHYAKVKNLLDISSNISMKGMRSVDLKAQMRIAPSELLQRKFANLVIDSVRLTDTDSGYAAMRNRYCAAKSEGSEEDYINRNAELVSRALGTTFPPETVEAYKKVMKGGRISFEITPRPGTELATLVQYPAKDVLEILGAKLTLDSHEVDFSKIEWGKGYSAGQSETAVNEEEATNSPSISKPENIPATYHPAAPASLGRYVGYKVRLKTRAGLNREGIIAEAASSTITLRQAASAGTGFISFPIALSEITSAEVLY